MNRSVLAAVAAGSLLVLPVRAAELRLDTVFTDTGRFEFTPKVTTQPEAPVQMTGDSLIGSSPSYEVWMEPSGAVEVATFDFFRYTIFVRPKARPAEVSRVLFQGKPVGAFDDQMTEVHFVVTDGAVHEEGSITLPIFGYSAPEVLSSRQPDDPHEVPLATARTIGIPLTNKLTRMPVTITGATFAEENSSLWTSREIRVRSGKKFTPFLIPRGATDDTSLQIEMAPRSAEAFATALIHGRNAPDDTQTMVISYKTLARDERSYSIPIRIRFVPWPPFLLLITAVTAPLGWLVLLLVKGKKKESWIERLKILGSAIIAGMAVEGIGMVLVLNNSELKIIGVTVDPFQMITAALIGGIAGLAGSQSRKLLLQASRIRFVQFGKEGTPDAV